ncbi:helix-turn-helix domain-containing protein [Candidatus Pelagibacter ubique]|nr:helix-turn-helix domain-containing protein [Candidatus Pelagibacter ubique]
MIKQNIFIINFDSLYEILDEIKDNLSFDIVKFKNIEDFLNTVNSNPNNLLIAPKLNEKSLLNKGVNNKNILCFDDLPLSINKVIEFINIKLIKLRFNHQSKINIKQYELNINSKFLSKDLSNLKLTEKEMEIILYLNDSKKKHDVLDLQKNIWEYSAEMETHTVETHIYRLRKKISDKFNDENFILSDKNGYFIS